MFDSLFATTTTVTEAITIMPFLTCILGSLVLATFALRVARWWDDLVEGLSPYPDPTALAVRVLTTGAAAYRDRDADLHLLDERRSLEPDWFQRPGLVGEGAPACPRCRRPLKPNIVLFGEDVRDMAEIARAMARCDALLVIGTSAQVHPAAGLPEQVHRRGGLIYEFNLGPTDLTRGQVGYWGCGAVSSDWLFQGPATVTVPLVVDAVVGGR